MLKKDNSLVVKKKEELENKEERTIPGRYYIPDSDIFETEKELVIMMDMPGVVKENIEIKLDKNVLQIDGRVSSKDYEKLEPLYTEYNVGHFSRSFRLSNMFDQKNIEAKINDGVLTLTLPKIPEAAPRKIDVL